jgi:hypothetical protein
VATLYRCRLPGDRLCACGKVARELRRQEVEFDEVRVAWLRRDRDEVQGLSGQRVVPLLVTDEATICDSRRIVEHLRRRAASEESVVGERGQAVVEEVAPKEPVLEELVLEEYVPHRPGADEPEPVEEPAPLDPVPAGQLEIEFFGPGSMGSAAPVAPVAPEAPVVLSVLRYGARPADAENRVPDEDGPGDSGAPGAPRVS